MGTPLTQLIHDLGVEVQDPEEAHECKYVPKLSASSLHQESFLLFSQSIPSQNLGFVDPHATELDLTINGHDLSIRQSPTILSSNRGGGTTGAVVWKITPLVASWLSSPANIFFQHGILHSQATVLELGCGISGIIGLTLGPLVESYVLTDQSYVMKLLNENLDNNARQPYHSAKGGVPAGKPGKKSRPDAANLRTSTPTTQVLDWEEDQVSGSLVGVHGKGSFDVVIACDCIYNDALIEPLVRTCVDACKLRSSSDEVNPTVVLVAQQLRSAEVFECWLVEFHKYFRTWRLPDEKLLEGLQSDSGFVVHVGVLR